MLYLSLMLILAGVSLAATASLMITFDAISGGEISFRSFLSPRNLPPRPKKWLRYGGAGLAAALLGMALAVVST